MKQIEVVAAIIIKGDKVFATQRGYGEFKGWWEFPGGKIEAGECHKEALKREIKEETNLDFTNPKLFDIKANVHMVYPSGDEVYYTDVVYEINDFYGELKHDGESTELRFFEINNLPDNIMPTQIGYIERFVKEKR